MYEPTVYYLPDQQLGPWERVDPLELANLTAESSEEERAMTSNRAVAGGEEVPPARPGVVDLATGEYLPPPSEEDVRWMRELLSNDDGDFEPVGPVDQLDAAWRQASCSSVPAADRERALDMTRKLVAENPELAAELVRLSNETFTASMTAVAAKERIELSHYRNSHGQRFDLEDKPVHGHMSDPEVYARSVAPTPTPQDDPWAETSLERERREQAERALARVNDPDIQAFVLGMKAQNAHQWKAPDGSTLPEVAAEVERQRQANSRFVTEEQRRREYWRTERRLDEEHAAAIRKHQDDLERNREFVEQVRRMQFGH